MLLPKHKILFTLNEVLKILEGSESYQISQYSYIPHQWYFNCYYNSMYYKLIIHVQNKTVKCIQIQLNLQTIIIDNQREYSELFNQIYVKSTQKIVDIENNKFTILFPNYTQVDDRDHKIESILELVDVSENKPKRKKLFGLF
jgi:hypothetical protein